MESSIGTISANRLHWMNGYQFCVCYASELKAFCTLKCILKNKQYKKKERLASILQMIESLMHIAQASTLCTSCSLNCGVKVKVWSGEEDVIVGTVRDAHFECNNSVLWAYWIHFSILSSLLPFCHVQYAGMKWSSVMVSLKMFLSQFKWIIR